VASKRLRSAAGFTMVETLVAIGLFAVVSTAFYSVLFATSRGSETARGVTRTSEEARLGFNRMLRDTREGSSLTRAQPNSFTVRVDFDADGAIALYPDTNSQGDYEELTYEFKPAQEALTLNDEILMRGVSCVESSEGGCLDAFAYSSNRLEYDWDRNGVTSWEELNDAPSHGVIGVGDDDNPPELDGPELGLLSNVTFTLAIAGAEDDPSTRVFAEAQLRNQR
jgi:prepilin-type N-terminal cleavage/methylation domain-containing protein